MRKLNVFAVVLALLMPIASSQAGWITSAAKAGARAKQAERAAGVAAAVEKAGVQAGKSGVQAGKAGAGAERAMSGQGAARSAANVDNMLAREAQSFGLRRANDGRFLLDAGRASAKLVQGRVLAALAQAPVDVLIRAADGRIMRLALAEPLPRFAAGLVLVADVRVAANGNVTAALKEQLFWAAQDAIADAVSTAFHQAVLNLREQESASRSGGTKNRAPPPGPTEFLMETYELLWVLQDDEVLREAKKYSVAKATGSPGASLRDVGEVLLLEEKARPTLLMISLAGNQYRHPGGPVYAMVNLDEILASIPMEGL